jgi:hypothetical protein
VCVDNGDYTFRTIVLDAEKERHLSGWSDSRCWAGLTFSPEGHSAVCWFDKVQPEVGCVQTGRPLKGPEVEVRELSTGSIRRHYSVSSPVTSCAISPNGRLLAVATTPGPVELWDLLADDTSLGSKVQSLTPQALWDGLSSEDGRKAFTTVLQMRANPTESIAFLRSQAKCLNSPGNVWTRERLRGLDAPAFRDREKATADLAAAGELILPQLCEALAKATPETRERLNRLIAKAEASPVKLGAIRAREVLAAINTPESRPLAASWNREIPEATIVRAPTPILLRIPPREK